MRLPGEPVVWADLDNDGDLDILTNTAESWSWNTHFLYWNEGGTNFTQTTPSFETSFRSAAAIDVDGDGDLDLITNQQFAQFARVYRNDGHRQFTDTGNTLSSQAAFSTAWFDADDDGDLDFAEIGRTIHRVPAPKLYRNEGHFQFIDANPELTVLASGTLRWGDFNQDSRPDILINGPMQPSLYMVSEPRVRLFFGNPSGGFTESAIKLPSFEGGPAEVMDLDGDGDIDFMISGTYSSPSPFRTFLYRNAITTRAQAPQPPTAMVASVAGSQAILSWTAVSGAPVRPSFNLRVGREPGAADVISPMSSSNGRLLAAALGNVQTSSARVLTGLQPGTYYWSVQSIDPSYCGSEFAEEQSFVISENDPLPAAPTISELPHIFLDEDEPELVSFSVGPASSLPHLNVTVESSNPNLAQASGLVLGGEGTNYTLAIRGATNQSGTSLITVRVSDAAGQSASSAFLLTVHPINDPPVVDLIPNQVTYENSPPLDIPFAAMDAETPSHLLTYSVDSSHPDLIPAAGVQVFAYENLLKVTPRTNRTGSAVITLRVSDGETETRATFVVTVLPQPFVPTFDRLANLSEGTIGWADFDGDQDLDLLLTGSNNEFWRGIVFFYRNHGTGQFEDPLVTLESRSWNIASVVDYDSDGDVDVMLTGLDFSTAGYSTSQVLRNNGSAGFTVVKPLGLIPVLDSDSKIAWGDMDNDGDLDMAYSHKTDTRILLNHNATFSESLQLPKIAGYVALGDYDGDAIQDIALSGTGPSGGTTNVILRGLGNGTFVDSHIILDQFCYGPVGFADLDGDGLLDFWHVEFEFPREGFYEFDRSVNLYRNRGGQGFAPAVEIPVALQDPSTIRWADFDGDGDLDFIIEVRQSRPEPGLPPVRVLGLYRNDGNFQFSFFGHPLPNADARYFSMGDFDNDGDVDLSAVYYETARNIRVLTNRLSQPNPPPASPTQLAAHVQGGSIWLSWHPATDFNQPGGLTYNVRVGSRPGIGDILPPMSLTNGFRQVVNFGNAGVRTNTFMTNLVGETFYWSAQAVDNSYIGGPFAPEQSFVIDLPGNSPPVISLVADLEMDEDSVQQVSFTLSDDRTPVDKLRLRAIPGNPFLLPAATLSFGGSGSDRTLRLAPALDQFGETVVTIEATDAAGLVSTSVFRVIVRGISDNPFILPIASQTNFYSAEPLVMTITIGDPDDSLEQLQLEGISSNEDLVPSANIAFSGTGSNRVATILAARPSEGETIVTITVADPAGNTSSESFLLTLENRLFRLLTTPFGTVRDGSLAWGDFDNDHHLDLAIAGQGLNQTTLYRNEGGGVFVKVNTYLPNVDGGGVAWADFDNDGDLDLLIHGRGQGAPDFPAEIYRNLGNGNFEPIGSGLVGRYGAAAWGDFDNDGRPDIVSTGSLVEYTSEVYRNLPGGQFQSVISFSGMIASGPLVHAGNGPWIDINEDGYLDLLLWMQTSFGWTEHLRIGNGLGEFSSAPRPWGGTAAAWADFDNDGRPDVLESTLTRDLRVLRNNGDGTFSPRGPSIQNNWTPTDVAVADFNNDGFSDFISLGYEGSSTYGTRVFENAGGDTWNADKAGLLDYHFATAAWADIDNDGDVDLLIDGQRNEPPLTGYSTSLYRNDHPRSNSAPTAPSGLHVRFTQDLVTFFWNPATDPEQTNGLTYNVDMAQ